MEEKPRIACREVADLPSVQKMANEVLQDTTERIKAFLRIEDGSMVSFSLETELAGHNNQICIVDLMDEQGNRQGTVCLKFSQEERKTTGLQLEANILDVLRANNILCPQIIASDFSNQNGFSYVVMEAVDGDCINKQEISLREAEMVLDVIQSHEVVLKNNLSLWQLSDVSFPLNNQIDFKTKVSIFLQNFVPHLVATVPLDFLNTYLNDEAIIAKRAIVTDRSVENIMKTKKERLSMIDFSTVRAGTLFDNWIQFIDDPKARFSCSREELIGLFFRKSGLTEEDQALFHVAAIYTNLLQGIFTHKKDPQLSASYINKVNESFKAFNQVDSELIVVV